MRKMNKKDREMLKLKRLLYNKEAHDEWKQGVKLIKKIVSSGLLKEDEANYLLNFCVFI